ncbi:MAG: tetratricopeptide repeat protein [Acidobacteriota bacterium]
MTQHTLSSHLFAGISFLGFVFALGGTLRLAMAECAWRWKPPVTVSAKWPLAIGNQLYFEDLAERHPALARSALRAAVRVNPRGATAWMALGLAAEQEGDMEQAAASFLEAERVDRQYLPAWTSANFFFRRGNDFQFWRAAKRAAAMSYDDPAPLIELADHREPQAISALERLGDNARLERGYLYLLIAQSRWREAEAVAARLSSHTTVGSDTRDRELLLNFAGRLIAAQEGEAALAVWNRLGRVSAPGPAGHGVLVNSDFEQQPSGEGFDWKMTEPPGGSIRWEPSRLGFWLAGSTPDSCTLLEQWVMLDPGGYRLRFGYRTEGLAKETGLQWALIHDELQDGLKEVSGAALARAPVPVSKPRVVEWDFRVAKAGLYRLAWVYSRVPGTIHQEGRAELAFAGLKKL